MTTLTGRRVMLRPLAPADFPEWQEVRRRNDDWLTPWEPARNPNMPDVVEVARGVRHALQRPRARAAARHRVRVRHLRARRGPARREVFAGEINLSSVQRGPFQSAYVGYWIDEAPGRPRVHARGAGGGGALRVRAGATCTASRSSIIPRNHRSRRVVEKLKLRDEGIAQRYLEINGVWEDHVRYAITIEEWQDRRDELTREWLA